MKFKHANMNILLALALVLAPMAVALEVVAAIDDGTDVHLFKRSLPDIDPSINIGLYKLVAKRSAPVSAVPEHHHHSHKPTPDKKQRNHHHNRPSRHVEPQISEPVVQPGGDSGVLQERIPKPLVGITLDQAEGRVPIRVGRGVKYHLTSDEDKNIKKIAEPSLDQVFNYDVIRRTRGSGSGAPTGPGQDGVYANYPARGVGGPKPLVGITQDQAEGREPIRRARFVDGIAY